MTFTCFPYLVSTKIYTNISCCGFYGLYCEMDNYARFRVIFENIYLHTGFINIALENSILKTEHKSEPETKL